MESSVEERKLWMALSDLFVDRDVDFVDIARNVCGYSQQEIELALFQRVAPICVWNILTPAPSVWLWFTEEQVIPEVELLIETRAKWGLLGKVTSRWTAFWMRWMCSAEWKALKAELIMIQKDDARS